MKSSNEQREHLLLREMPLLFVDIQASGARPPKAHPLNVAWCMASAADLEGSASILIEDRWITPPEDHLIPRRIRRMLELDNTPIFDPQATTPIEDCQADLLESLEEVPHHLWIAHYNRFEEAFLSYFCTDSSTFDNAICTHQIARRLLAGLPRRGIAAVAGYFGYRLDGRYRARCHVEATLEIWRNFVEILDNKGVETLEELHQWLNDPETISTSSRYPMDRQRRLDLPRTPGIYRFVDRNDHTLYIGKASDLNNRVNSYFRTRRGLSESKLEMISQAADIHIQSAPSPLEAALAEVDAIKEYQPPYNVALQPREIALTFADPLGQLSPVADIDFRYGPFLSTRSLLEFLSIWNLTANQDLEFEHFLPPLPGATANDGRMIFSQRHGLSRSSIDLPTVWRIGNQLWLRKALEQAEASQPIQEDEPLLDSDEIDQNEDEEFIWTGPTVADALERRCHRVGFALRRGRLLARLTDVEINWEPRSGSHERRSLQLGDKSPSASILTQMNRLDFTTYQRMRVLSTEIRTLLATGHDISISAGGRVFTAPDLRRIWSWI